jgi:hypothetical protein
MSGMRTAVVMSMPVSTITALIETVENARVPAPRVDASRRAKNTPAGSRGSEPIIRRGWRKPRNCATRMRYMKMIAGTRPFRRRRKLSIIGAGAHAVGGSPRLSMP